MDSKPLNVFLGTPLNIPSFLMCLKDEIYASLDACCYKQFNNAFCQLMCLAKQTNNNPEAITLLFEIHDYITSGATTRILKGQETLTLDKIKISPERFKLFVNRYYKKTVHIKNYNMALLPENCLR